jgi:hypothetical protein
LLGIYCHRCIAWRRVHSSGLMLAFLWEEHCSWAEGAALL